MAYSAVYVFGDSLVDCGNALKLAEWYDGLPFSDLPEGAPTTELGYFKGRFSDGYTFADLISNKAIGTVTKPIFPYDFEDPWLGIKIAPFASDPNGNNLNFAYGGAHIRQGDEVVPDLDDQTDAFRDAVDGDAPPGALYLVTTGGNDIRELAPTGSNPVPQAEAYAELQRCADELFEELAQLVDHGAHNIVITGIPDVGLIPHYDRDGDGVLNATEQMRSDAATDYSIYLDALIRAEVVPALQALGANVTYVPVMDYVDAGGQLVTGAFSAILPTIAALHGLTTEELSNNLLQYKELVFFDHVHPNAQAHALVGSYMQAMIAGTPWIETLPLTSAEVDYSLTASITVAGEVDQLVIAMVAGTTYTFDMLGVSSLGTFGSLADPSLRLLGPAGGIVGADDDSGAGFDATISFAAAGTGNHTLQLFAVGSVTGTYVLQAAVVGGAAMLAGNSYAVSSASVLVLEGAGGVGEDVVKTSVSYALSAGSEIEVLRTANDQGKSAINLTGNEFGQTLIGNGGANILEGKGGADTLIGGGGKDMFVLSMDSPSAIDRIADYAKGEIVDVTRVLSVAAGTNLTIAGYLRVTKGGLIQVDQDGGGDGWVTLSTINGNSAVTFRYLSGGLAATVSLSRVSDSQQLARSAANANPILASAVAAAGLAAIAPAPMVDAPDDSSGVVDAQASVLVATSPVSAALHPSFAFAAGALVSSELVEPAPRFTARDEISTASSDPQPHRAAVEWLEWSGPEIAAVVVPVARSVSIPSADMLALLEAGSAEGAQSIGEVSRIAADALEGAGGHSPVVDALLDAFLAAEPVGGLRAAWLDPGELGQPSPMDWAHQGAALAALALHSDLVAIA
jgi:phospholipase/lecithinase/hemolysin